MKEVRLSMPEPQVQQPTAGDLAINWPLPKHTASPLIGGQAGSLSGALVTGEVADADEVPEEYDDAPDMEEVREAVRGGAGAEWPYGLAWHGDARV